MCVIEALIAVMSSGKPLELPDGTRLTPGEAAGMLSRLDLPGQWLILARGGDSEARALLRGWLWQAAAGMAAKHGWRIEKGKPRLEGMAECVCREMVNDSVPSSVRNEARDCGYACHMKYFLSPWRDRMFMIRSIGQEVAITAKRGLKKEIFDATNKFY